MMKSRLKYNSDTDDFTSSRGGTLELIFEILRFVTVDAM